MIRRLLDLLRLKLEAGLPTRQNAAVRKRATVWRCWPALAWRLRRWLGCGLRGWLRIGSLL